MDEELESYVIQLSNYSNTIESLMNGLSEAGDVDKSNLINQIFRETHSLKATSHYHNFEEISILIEKTEDIIFFIRNYNCCFSKSVIKWFFDLVDQVDIWVKQIEDSDKLEYYSIDFETAPTVTCKSYTSPELNEMVEIIILNKDYTIASSLADTLEVKFKYVKMTTTIEETIKIISTPGKKLLISDLKFEDGNIIELITQLTDLKFDRDDLFILSKFNKPEAVTLFKQKLKTENIYNSKNIKMLALKNLIINHVEKASSVIEIPINNSKISLIELSNYIQPLPVTLLKLKDACFSSTSSIRDISNIVSEDPMFTAIVLRSINSPYIGLTNRVTKISIAVSLLGKKQIGSMTIVETAKDAFGTTELEAYETDITKLIDVSMKRAQFVTEWIKYIDLAQEDKDDILSLIHLIPLGTIITNQAIIYDKMVERFKSQNNGSKPIASVETLLLGFNNLDVVGKLFTIWNIPNNLR